MLHSKTLQTRFSTDVPSDKKIPSQQSKTYQHDLFMLSYQVDRHPHNILSYKRRKNSKRDKMVVEDRCKKDEKSMCTIDGFLREDELVGGRIKEDPFDPKERIKQEDRQQKWKTLDPKKWKNATQQKLRMRTQSRESSQKQSKKVHSLEREPQIIKSKITMNTLPNKETTEEVQATIQDQHLMNWLNQVLTDYCFQDYPKDITYKALERFGLDKSTLLSRSLSPETIGNLYRSLFSHSIGFQTCLKDISHNKLTLKSIWKAYAILLQYCSEGYFETMMGDMQRDMIKNQQRLLIQIQKRQKIIDNGEEMMQKKMAKLERENKELKKDNKELAEKKEQLQNDFREMEMGYNMEVSLRLNYEHKINKVYSIHQRLNLLHQNLFKDFKATDEINKNISNQSSNIKSKNIELTIDYQEALKEMTELKSIIQSKESIIEGLKMNEEQLEEKISLISQVKKEEVYQMKEKERKVSRMEQELKSSNLVIEILKGTANSQLQEYKRVSQENMEMRNLKQEQYHRIEELLAEIIGLNSKQSTLKSQLAHYQKELQKVQQELREEQEENERLKAYGQGLEVDIKARQLEIQTLKKTIQSFQLNMKEMKVLYERSLQECKMQKKYSAEIKLQIEDIREKKMELDVLVKKLQEAKFDTQLQLNRKIKEIIILKKQQENENKNFTKKYNSLHEIWSTQEQSINKLQGQLEKTKTELEEANHRISFLSQRYTDLSFEKAKIEAIYTNNLVLHDNQKKSQKNLIIQVSQLNQKYNDMERELAKTVKLHQQKEKGWEREKQRTTVMIQKLKQKVAQKQEYVPEIVLEDALSMVQRERMRYQQLKNNIDMSKEKENEKESALKMEFRKRELELKGQLIDQQKKTHQITTELQHQLEYEKNKIANLKASEQRLQIKLKSQTLELEIKAENQTNQRVQVLMKQKNKQIKELYAELQRIEDNFNKKSFQYEEQINQLKVQNIELQTLKQEKQILHEKMVQLQQEQLSLITEKKEMMQEIKKSAKKGESGKGVGQVKRGDFAKKLEMVTKYYHR